MNDHPLQGQRILVAEDNALLALSMHDILRRAGADVVGPAGTLHEAEELAASERLTLAMLDIKLQSREVWPAARILIARGVPILFCSGHFDSDTLPNEWSDFPILTKPVRANRIIDSLAGVINSAAA